MDHQTLQLALTMEKLDNALAKLQEIQYTLRGHRSLATDGGDHKQRCNEDSLSEKLWSTPTKPPLVLGNSRSDAVASINIAKRTSDMMKVQRNQANMKMMMMMKKKASTPSPLTHQKAVPITLLHPSNRLNLPHLHLEEALNGSGKHGTTFTLHHHGDHVKQPNVAKSSKENRKSARQPSRNDFDDAKLMAVEEKPEQQQQQNHHNHQQQQQQNPQKVHEQQQQQQNPQEFHEQQQQQQHQQEKNLIDEKRSCIVKRRIKKDPLDIIMAMPPSFCVQAEEVKSKSNRRRRNSWAGAPMPSEKKKPIVMFPNPTFDDDRSSNKDCDLNKTEKVSKMQEKVVRLAPCHASGSVGKPKVDRKEHNSGRFMHPIRDSLKRTSAFMKAFSSKEK